jgi:hypothetical protein
MPLTKIASIKHNDNSRTDRVILYRSDESDYVYAGAGDEQPYETDCLCAYHWINYVWSSPNWDLTYEPDVDLEELEIES